MDRQGIRTLFDRETRRLKQFELSDHAESGLVSRRIQTSSPPATPNSVKKRDTASGPTQARSHTVCAVMTFAFLDDWCCRRGNELALGLLLADGIVRYTELALACCSASKKLKK